MNPKAYFPLVVLVLFPLVKSFADVPPGNEDSAKKYYRGLAKTLSFSSPEKIFQTTLDDVADYLGYKGITGIDLQNIPSAVLMNTEQLLLGNVLQNRDAVIASFGATPFRPDEILAIRFFAPKIMNIKEPESTRKLGWRKLVRLRSRPGSVAKQHNISSGIILFNIFTAPGAIPFSQTDESVNTQVMLITETNAVPKGDDDGPDTVYWLDYDKLSKGGLLSFALHASFDANELPQSSDGSRDYFVPEGCVACHGNNTRRSMVNYLDTDHWFDRLENDFPALKTNGIALLFDAQTNDRSSVSYTLAFDVIRRFNAEADEEVQKAQHLHDEALASEKWLGLHATNTAHFPPIDRAIGPEPHWKTAVSNDEKALNALNQYCFRCHGTVKFSVFNRQSLAKPEMIPNLEKRLQPNAPLGMKMPPDRELPEDIRTLLLQHLIQ